MTQLIINDIITTYTIDEDGNIYNTKTKKFLKGTIRSGYRMVNLTINKTKKDYCVHKLVATTFIPNPENKPQVNHKDRNKLNNSVSNLEWVSASENMQHVVKTGRKERQPILPIAEEITEENGWKQFRDTNYWFNLDGRGANIKTKKYLNVCKNKSDGYCRYYLYIEQQRKVFLAHKIIYEVFSGEDMNADDKQINHKDGDKANNSFCNLEKVSRSENVQHSCYVLGKKVKPVAQYSLDGKLIKEYPSIKQASRELGCYDSAISQVCKNKMKTYKGFIWKYI